MTTLALGSTVTVTLAVGESVTVATNGGRWWTTTTPLVGPVVGPSPHLTQTHRTFGPLTGGGTVAITNQTSDTLVYIQTGAGVVSAPVSIANGTSSTVTLGDQGSVAVANPGGYWSATITPAIGAAVTQNHGPLASNRVFGPYPAGATVVLNNITGGPLVAVATNSGSPASIVPAGGLKTLTAVDATPIDPVVTSSGPSTGSAIGASGSGFVVTVVLKGISSLVGTCVPTALTLSVADPGYDTSGNATVVSRTLTGVAQVRRQYPNGGSKMIATDGTDLTLLITVDDCIYAGTTIVSATIGSSFYTGCTAGNTGATVVNSSATPYTKPLFAWFNFQEDRVTASTLPVEAVAFHRHATAGQQVACVKYNSTDGTNVGASVTVSTPSLSAMQTTGNIAEVWPATVDVSTLTSATMCTVNAKVYPWLGDASAVLDLSASGVTWPSSLPLQPLHFYNDQALTYGGAFAYVKVGASGGVVSSTAATAKATPFPTVTSALSALVTWNNTTSAGHSVTHADIGGGIVRLMDNAGVAQTHTIGGNMTQAGGVTHCVIEADPANTAAVSYTWSAQGTIPEQIQFRNITFLATASSSFMLLGKNVSRQQVFLKNCTFDESATVKPAITQLSQVSMINTLIAGGSSSTNFNNLPPTIAAIVMNVGMTVSGGGTLANNSQAVLTAGCVLQKFVYTQMASTSDGDHGRIAYNNKFYRALVAYGSAVTINSGLANVQNLFEHDGVDADVRSMNFFADSDLTTITNYIEFHTTAVGNRASRLYNDNANTKVAPTGMTKAGMSKYCVWDNYNIKTDPFTSGIGSTGNWAYCYGMGNVGNVSLFGDVGRSASSLPHNDNADGPYLGMAWLPSSEANLLRTALGFTQAQIMAMFTNYTVGPQASPAVGGDYTPLSTSANLKGRVPAGRQVLKKDLAGLSRRTDGTGAAGAYESL